MHFPVFIEFGLSLFKFLFIPSFIHICMYIYLAFCMCTMCVLIDSFQKYSNKQHEACHSINQIFDLQYFVELSFKVKCDNHYL